MVIREARPSDAKEIAEIYAPIVRETAISFEEEPPDAAEMARRIRASQLWLVASDHDAVVGYAYAASFHPRAAYRWSVEVSIYLSPVVRASGLGRRLLTELLEQLRQGGFVNAFAGVTIPNPASVRLFESFGFEKIAHWANAGFKLGSWHDVGWWQLQLRETTVPPPRLPH